MDLKDFTAAEIDAEFSRFWPELPEYLWQEIKRRLQQHDDLCEALDRLLTGHPSGDSPEQKIARAALVKARGNEAGE